MTDILVSAGAEKFVGGTVRETTGKDITAATFDVSLGSATYPGSWVPATTVTAGASNAERVVKLKVTAATPGLSVPGQYWVWVRVHDADEIEPLRIQGPINIK